MRPERRRLIGWLGAAAWAGLIFWQSSTSDAGGMLRGLPPGSDKVLHAGAYFVLSAFLTLATGRPALAATVTVAYGVSDELHQAFVPGRFADVWDLVADAVGAALGASVVGYLLRRRKAPNIE